jgi:uncharacterized protein
MLLQYLKNRRLALVSVLLLILLAGCAGHRRAAEDTYASVLLGNYQGALAGLERSSLAGSKNNRLLFLMEKGVLLHLAGDFRESNHILEEADRLAEELFTRSLSAETMSFISNDNVIPYAGEDYESVYINYYKARNYLALGDLQAARVESRKVDEKLNYFTDSYQGRNVFKESAFLRLLTGLIYEAENDPNNAFIAYRNSLEAYRAYQRKYQVQVPVQLWGRLLATARAIGFTDEYERFKEEARADGVEPEMVESMIAVIVDLGFAPVKREAYVLFPTTHGFPVKLALPAFEDRPRRAGHVQVSMNGDGWLSTERFEDVGVIARQSLEDKKGRVLAKMIARAVSKQLAARRAEKELGPLAGLLAQVAALATENADLRSWTMLPDQVQVALLPATPGRHTIAISRGAHHETHEVEVQEGGVGFVLTRIY